MPRRVAITFAVLACVAALPSLAGAAGPGRWEPINNPQGDAISRVGLLRDAAGTLHVAWSQIDVASDVVHRTVAPSGSLGQASPIATGYATVGHPSLIAEGASIRAMFGALRSTDSSDPVNGIVSSLSTDGGGSWATPEGTTPDSAPSGTHGGTASAITLPDGQPLTFSSGSGFGVVSHKGLDRATPIVNWQESFSGNECCTVRGTALRDGGAGAPVLIFSSLVTGRQGIFAQAIGPDGGPAGGPVPFPNVGPAGGGPDIDINLDRTPAATRPGGGVFVIHAGGLTDQRVLLWRVGGGSSPLVTAPQGTRVYTASVAGTPDGRIWAIWSEEANGEVTLVARRSNPTVSRFGERQEIEGPSGAQRIFTLDSSSQRLKLDVFANTGPFQHTQIRPPLELTATPRTFRGGRTTTVRVRVTDVGVPVSGVSVRSQGAGAITANNGRATLRVRGPRRGGAILVSATKTDYVRDRLSLRVTRARRR